MVALSDTSCIHCERRPGTGALGLCAACQAVKGIRVLYLRRRGWTPEWEAHLRRLTRRAQQRRPLFGGEPSGVEPEEGSDACRALLGRAGRRRGRRADGEA
jgi:hypothetical protein